MKNILLLTFSILSIIMLDNTAKAQNLVVDPSFEGYSHDAEGLANIAPNSDFDDLPTWLNVGGSPDLKTNTSPVPISNTLINTGDPANPYAPYNPRTGHGCLNLAGSATDQGYYEFVSREVTGLVIGNSYSASFYVLRRPTAQWKAKLALTVHTSQPIKLGRTNALSPAPVATITSDYIVDTPDWVLVSGTFVAQATSYWIAIGYDVQTPVNDTNLAYPTGQYASAVSYGINHAIDDVDVHSLGCVSPPSPQIGPRTWTCNDGFGPIFVDIVNYDPALTYSITTTNNIRNSPPGITANTDPSGVTHYQFQLRATRAGMGGVTVTATNSCGSAISTTAGVTVPNCNNNRTEATTAYPNPSAESLAVPAGAENATLLNSQGQLVQRPDTNGRFNVRSLPAGIYNLQMRQDGQLINQRIEVKH